MISGRQILKDLVASLAARSAAGVFGTQIAIEVVRGDGEIQISQF